MSKSMQTSLDAMPTAFVGLLISLATEVIQQTQATIRNRETFEITRGLVESILECLTALEELPNGSLSLMVALYRTSPLLRTAREFATKYGGENIMKQMLFADKWAKQVDALHTDLVDLRQELCNAIGHTITLMQGSLSPVVQNQLTQLATKLTDKRQDDLEVLLKWRNSPHVHPEAGPGRGGSMEIIQVTLAQAITEPKGSAGINTALALGRSGNWPGVIKHLVSNPEEVKAHGHVYSLLHYAVLWEDIYAVSLLLSLGADVNCRTREYDEAFYLPANSTPLHLAAALGCETLCRLLICWGADLELEDDWGHTPANLETTEKTAIILTSTGLYDSAKFIAEKSRDLHFGHLLGTLEAMHPIPLDIRATPTSDYFLLHHAARSGNPYIYHLLVAAGATPLLRTTKTKLLPSEVLTSQPTLAGVQAEIQETEIAAWEKWSNAWCLE